LIQRPIFKPLYFYNVFLKILEHTSFWAPSKNTRISYVTTMRLCEYSYILREQFAQGLTKLNTFTPSRQKIHVHSKAQGCPFFFMWIYKIWVFFSWGFGSINFFGLMKLSKSILDLIKLKHEFGSIFGFWFKFKILFIIIIIPCFYKIYLFLISECRNTLHMVFQIAREWKPLK
jgi:hypothetical protein